MRAGKSTLYEGGIRVPLIVRYPKMVPASTVCATPTCNYDFYPTFCDLAGVKPKSQKFDGVSIAQLLANPKAGLDRDTFYWHYPLAKPHFLGGRSASAIRKGDWKLIEFYDLDKRELYNLADDVSESNDLAAKNPQKVAQLQATLHAWLRDVGASVPSKQ